MSQAPSDDMLLFIEDALEHLDACDKAVLLLDEAVSAGRESAREDLNTLFRGMHTIKGNAGMLGFSSIVSVAHALEEMLDKLRAGKIPMSREVLDLTFAGLDSLRSVVLMLQAGQEARFDPSELLALLGELEGEGAAPAATEGLERFAGWTLVEPKEAASLLAEVDAGESQLFRLTFAMPAIADPMADPSFEKLQMLGHAVAWRYENANTLAMAYVTRATQEILERFKPDNAKAIAPWHEGPAPEATRLVAASESAETAAPAEAIETSIRVGITLLDKLMNLVGELVLTRNQIFQHVQGQADHALLAPTQRLNLLTTELQETVMRTRMQPVGHVWDKFPRLVRDYSRQSGKQIQLSLEGAETELDKSLLETIKDPLTHLVRNALDHGIESPEARAAAGKPPTGTVTLLAYHNGGQIVIEIKDDGRGLDYDRIRSKALAQGLVSAEQLARMSEGELAALIFHPGLSTAETVTSISGRGVGMDVVKSNIERIGGTIELSSTPGHGSAIKLRIPLTLAVIPALIIKAGAERFAIPQAAVLEVVRMGEGLQRLEQFRESLVFRLRDSLIPVVSLRRILGQAASAEAHHLVVLQAGPLVFGLAVDEIGDTEEIVVKSLHRFIQAIEVYAGVTIMGDGQACMILDVNGLASRGGIDMQAHQAADEAVDEPEEALGTFQRMLLTRIGERTFAIPMALVSRLEEFAPERLERVGPRLVVQYGQGLLQVAEVEVLLGIAPMESEKARVIVIGEGERMLGLKVTAILDIVEDHLQIHAARGVTGVLGAVVIHGRTTEILDVHGLLEQVFPAWSPQNKGQSEQRRILLVEDSPFFRSLLRSHLEGVGYRVFEANNGEEGLKMLEQHPIDVVLSDIEMPQVDGLAFIRRMRQREAWRHLPAIALTSVNRDEMRQTALELGFDRFLTKYDRDAVLAALASLQPDEADRLEDQYR